MRTASILLIGLIGLAGCGPTEPPATVVTGKVTMKGAPVAGALVQFIPLPKSKGSPGSGRTNAEGVYTLMSPKGKSGVLPGEYKVTVSRFVRPDGKELPPDASPFTSEGKETLPPHFSSGEYTQLVATVPGNPTATIDFPLGPGGAAPPTGAKR